MSDAVCHCEEGIDLRMSLPSDTRVANTICSRFTRVYSASINGLSDHMFREAGCFADIDHENDQVP